LVHEAYLRLGGQDSAADGAKNRRQFFSLAARAMRRILVDHARFHAAARRPSPRGARPYDERLDARGGEAQLLEILAVDEAMDWLKTVHGRRALVVELRYFAGLEESEVAEILELSRATVSRDWRVARLLLNDFLASGSPCDPSHRRTDGSRD
ncbi:MAG: ECF-type sigma factor, partial [Acidobacteriota bacterium]